MKIKVNDEISQNIADIELGSISLANIIDLIRPIGSLYWSEKNTNPSTIYPGTTWVQVTDTWIVAAGSTYAAGSSYGAASHTHTSAAHTHTVNGHTHTTGNHTLTVAEMPSHRHGIDTYVGMVTSTDAFALNDSSFDGLVGSDVMAPGVNSTQPPADRISTIIGLTGSNGAHNHGDTGSTSLTTNSTTPGNTGSSSNIPPSVAMYCWKRTA